MQNTNNNNSFESNIEIHSNYILEEITDNRSFMNLIITNLTDRPKETNKYHFTIPITCFKAIIGERYIANKQKLQDFFSIPTRIVSCTKK